MALPTLLDIAKRSGNDAVIGLIDEASRQTPELTGQVNFRGKSVSVPNVGASRTIKGRQFKSLVRTALPTAGYRDANQGVVASKSTYENRLFETYILNPRWECDKAVAQSSEDGSEAFIADEAIAMTTAGLMTVAKQFYYDTSLGHAKGGPGLLQAVDASLVIDAGGTTDNVASSVWGVHFGPKGVQFVWGDEGSMEMADVREGDLKDADGNPFTGYIQELLAYPGIQVSSKFCIGRIKKLTTDANKGLTDALLGKLVSAQPVGWMFDAIFASRRSLEQLRASRTATNATGAEAPTPTEFEGIPIIPTDSILDTETLAL